MIFWISLPATLPYNTLKSRLVQVVVQHEFPTAFWVLFKGARQIQSIIPAQTIVLVHTFSPLTQVLGLLRLITRSGNLQKLA